MYIVFSEQSCLSAIYYRIVIDMNNKITYLNTNFNKSILASEMNDLDLFSHKKFLSKN